jgi:D-hydroxyproline dehydrogenase subunit gamma
MDREKNKPASLRIAGIDRSAEIHIRVNGRSVPAVPGETVLAALTAAGYRVLKKSNVHGEPRGPFCGMGVCYECLVTIDGVPKQRSCMVEAADNMEIALYEPERG